MKLENIYRYNRTAPQIKAGSPLFTCSGSYIYCSHRVSGEGRRSVGGFAISETLKLPTAQSRQCLQLADPEHWGGCLLVHVDFSGRMETEARKLSVLWDLRGSGFFLPQGFWGVEGLEFKDCSVLRQGSTEEDFPYCQR